VRAVFTTSDGADVYVTAKGYAQSNGADYLHTNFETGNPTYYWLNKAVGFGVLTPRLEQGFVAVDVYLVRRFTLMALDVTDKREAWSLSEWEPDNMHWRISSA